MREFTLPNGTKIRSTEVDSATFHERGANAGNEPSDKISEDQLVITLKDGISRHAILGPLAGVLVEELEAAKIKIFRYPNTPTEGS